MWEEPSLSVMYYIGSLRVTELHVIESCHAWSCCGLSYHTCGIHPTSAQCIMLLQHHTPANLMHAIQVGTHTWVEMTGMLLSFAGWLIRT